MEDEMKRKSILVLTLICIIALLAACTNGGESKAPQLDEQNTTLPTVDRAGNEISIPKEINKIISLSPSNTEILIELGFGDKIIATDEYSKDLVGLPEGIPLFDMMAPDAEQIVALEPDIIYTTEMSLIEGNDPYKPIKDIGICVAFIPASESIEGIYEDIIFFAKSLSVEDKGVELVNNMITKIEEIKEIGSTIENKKTVYFEIAAAPSLYSFGSGVFLNEIIEIIGAKNVLAEHDWWISVSEEVVIASDPDVIITNVDYVENPVEEIKSRSGWENMTAVKNNDVYYVDNYATSHSNHNIIIGLEQMAKAIYPEIY
jgi:iron complex transport system substrate-binding protein